MKAWYTVKAMEETIAIYSNPQTVEYDFFGDLNSCEDVARAIEIAQNKLHTTECVSLQFKAQCESED